MRVRLGILLVLLAAACGGLIWTHASVNGQKDQMDIQVTTVAGDVSAVEGTEVTLEASLLDRLFWTARCVPGKEPAVQTEFTRYWNEHPLSSEWDSGGMYVSLFNSNWYGEDSEEEPDRQGLTTLLEAVAEHCPAGTDDYWETVRMRDYYEEFPLFVGSINFMSRGSAYTLLDGNDSLEMMAQDTLRQVFHIPVPEDLMVDVQLGKNTDGSIYMANVSAEWDLDASSVATEQGLYFTLLPSDPAVTLDFSQCAVEQGLYFLPIHQEPYAGNDYEGVDDLIVVSMDGAQIRTVCPAPGVESSWLGTSEDGTWIYYAAQTEEEITLWVLDAQSGDIVSQAALPFGPADFPDGAYLSGAIVDEGLVMLYRQDDRFVLVTVSEEGEAAAAISGDLQPLFQEADLEQSDLIYDGNRLVMTAYQGHDYSFCLAAYTLDGLAYLGRYDVGLDLISSGTGRLWRAEGEGNSLDVRFVT
ncbi:hypothetical protein [uncultured Oscillibacter sp.]|uniref:TolB family protein n=1 Tax=uncultured Oscillibacter sp. TaxID=876091 RepID=UPI0025E0A8E1|nr:hypothetical protein [uncultured Oscillibacter sp.]